MLQFLFYVEVRVMERINVRNIKLVIEYDGTDFCGWQKQPNVRTVEGELVRALKDLTGSEPEIVAAGRTDSGVHAIGQVVNFSTLSGLSAERLKNALNSVLPSDVRIVECSDVPLAFNSRFDAKFRVYRYEIMLRPTSIWRRYRWYIKWNLNLDVMRKASEYLIGEHDFSSFTCKAEERSPWINMSEMWIKKLEPDGIALEFKANRFLRKMVRLIVGTLVEVGRGRMTPDTVCDILRAAAKARAGPCAPAHGLYLVRVEY